MGALFENRSLRKYSYENKIPTNLQAQFMWLETNAGWPFPTITVILYTLHRCLICRLYTLRYCE